MDSFSWTLWTSVLCETLVPHGTASLKSQSIMRVIYGRQDLLLLVCLFGTQNVRVTCCVVELLESVVFVSVCVLAGFLSPARV